MAKRLNVGIRHAAFGRQRLRVKFAPRLRTGGRGNLFNQARVELVFHKPGFHPVRFNLIDNLSHLRCAGFAL